MDNKEDIIAGAKVIVNGGRDYSDYVRAEKEIRYFTRHLDNVVIVSGACSDSKNGVLTFTRDDGTKVYGADGLGERYAKEHNIPVILCPANWNKNGKAAGPIRNSEMSVIGTHLLSFWDGKSTGTGDMIKKARSKKLVIEIVNTQSSKIDKP